MAPDWSADPTVGRYDPDWKLYRPVDVGVKMGDRVRARLFGWDYPNGFTWDSEPPELPAETLVEGSLVVGYLEKRDEWSWSINGHPIDPSTIEVISRTPDP